ncbi:MAG TPA: hypothetical protein VK447_14590 [Myxococcaceae bacterium]|nr:hypothetical protein [Myxococcaceae bacterium]
MQARSAARMEELERKVEGGFEALRQAARAPAAGDGLPLLPWEELWDAMDALEDAAQSPAAGASPGLEEGLRRVLGRLERFVGHARLERVATLGEHPDGRLFRVVGTLEHPGLAEGAVSRVVRAAIVRDGHAVREGEVLINRRAS